MSPITTLQEHVPDNMRITHGNDAVPAILSFRVPVWHNGSINWQRYAHVQIVPNAHAGCVARCKSYFPAASQHLLHACCTISNSYVVRLLHDVLICWGGHFSTCSLRRH